MAPAARGFWLLADGLSRLLKVVDLVSDWSLAHLSWREDFEQPKRHVMNVKKRKASFMEVKHWRM
jgi:hypothetical protein